MEGLARAKGLSDPAVADAYDAMTSDRPYRKAMTPERALFEIQSCAATQFDPQLAPLFIMTLQKMKGRTDD